MITNNKRSYLWKIFQENNTANKDIWTKINKIVHKRTKRIKDIDISENDTILTNQKTISNKFNQCFINTAKTLIENIGKSSNKFQDFLKNPNGHSFFTNESTPEEIMGLIKKLDTIKSADICRISSKLIKIAAERIICNMQLFCWARHFLRKFKDSFYLSNS